MEIEIKVKIENTANLLKLLEAEGTHEYTHHQVDEYFNAPHRDFTATKPIEEWLRLRDSDGHYSINYKKWHYNNEGISNHADEFETKTESIGDLRKLFAALDFTPLITVDKTRTAYNYKEYEIAFDAVVGLGNFVEVEYKANTDAVDPKEITNGMMAFLQGLECGTIERSFKGYPYMLLEQKGLIAKE